MPRERRQILRSLFTNGSRKFWRLKTDRARLLYIALILNADDFGRLEGDPVSLSSYLPRADWDKKELQTCLRDLLSVGLVQEYSHNSESYLYVVGFEESQSWHGLSREPSTIPPPPGKPDMVKTNTRDGEVGSPRPPLTDLDQKSIRTDKKEKKRVEKFVRGRLATWASQYRIPFRLNRGFEGWILSECERLGVSEEDFVETLEWAARVCCDDLKGVRNPASYIKVQFEGWLEQYQAVKEPTGGGSGEKDFVDLGEEIGKYS